jgi:hypothetical protein
MYRFQQKEYLKSEFVSIRIKGSLKGYLEKCGSNSTVNSTSSVEKHYSCEKSLLKISRGKSTT